MTAPQAAKPPRRSFARRWSLRLGVGAVALALVAGALLLWLLATPGGRDTLLDRVVGLLPADSLRWEQVEGTVYGPLVLRGLRYDHDGVVFTAERVLLDARLLPVLGRRLQLDRLEVDGAVLVLPPADDEPFALPSWPDVMPRLPMPLQINTTAMAVDGLRIERDGATLIDIGTLAASALQLSDDGFSVESLAMDASLGKITLKGEYLPARNYRTDLSGAWIAAATPTMPAANLQLNAKGDLSRLSLDVVGNAPEPLSLSLLLQGAAAAPDWTLTAQSQGLQPALLGMAQAEPWRFAVDATGQGGQAKLQGEVAQGEWRIGIEPSTLRLESQLLRAQPLQLLLPQGPLTITGELRLAGDASDFDAVVSSPGLRLDPASAEPGALPVTATGELRASGRLQAWAVEGEARLERGDEQATVRLSGEGDANSLRLDALNATTPTGSLDGSGTLAWSPALSFAIEAQLADFDPGYFVPDYPGALSGRVQANADQQPDGQWRANVQMPALQGQLRGRPVSGRLAADWTGDRGTGDAALRIGDSVIDLAGDFGARYDLQARFAPLLLDDVLAGAQGSLQGTVSLRGTATAPDITAQLQGDSLRWGDQSAATLQLKGTLPATGSAGLIEAEASDVLLSGFALDRLALRGSGSLAALQFDAQANGGQGELEVAGRIGRRGQQWRGRIGTLRLAANDAPQLRLEAGADFEFGPGLLRLLRSCLVANDPGGRLCVAATGSTISVQGESLPLALAQPWLPADQGLPLGIDGTLDATVELRRGRDGSWRGDARLASERGALRLAQDLEREVFSYRDLAVDLQVEGDAITGSLQAALADEGRVSARVRTGLADSAALDGELTLDVRNLTWLELLSPDLAAPAGRLQGTLLLAGPRGPPQLSGQAQLQPFSAELPALGLKLTQGQFALVGNVDGTSRLEGTVRSGEGVLQVEGSLNFRDATAPLQLVLRGENVTLASTPELYLIGTPEITLRWLPDRLELRGTLAVPEARADLEALDGNVSVSPDVVVVDAIDPARERSKPLDMDFSVSLGDKVKLKGFGLDGSMTGALRLRERLGRRATASGTLQVTGKYRAYGQSLTIQRARLSYADAAFDNPTLDIRAERVFDDVTVGVQVRGTASRPDTTVVSNPAMETSEALSWLVFGRPLSTTTAGENEQLGAAALALGVGGNLVAQQLGASLGFDEAGVSDSRNLGGATFTVGKYVLPRLFLSYGVSLVGTGQVVTLKYLLSRGFDVTIESGNESAASLNWRTER
ncbi:MAG: translocation/assembly module TamB domain-containing protein [Arenimonas sp.]|uniref:translocation/assembly module TamB domain-containing protein n=1 Tax=Arenimonas sp. TaxID=1872635 RepID=UPI0025BE8E4D|nr:translocation/assembly module TamB domain-containing protein [Arenimonas sp.]MBW8369218.1 translocation/assembly module TamB domain-containing protein [Arenimonas sp.]